jgi:hypothetical protein
LLNSLIRIMSNQQCYLTLYICLIKI